MSYINTTLLIIIAFSLLSISSLLAIQYLVKKKKNEAEKINQPNAFGAGRDILVSAMAYGQLPVAGVILIFLIIASKMSGESDERILSQIILLLHSGLAWTGWLFVIIISIVSSISISQMKKLTKREVDFYKKELIQKDDKIKLLNEEIELQKRTKKGK